MINYSSLDIISRVDHQNKRDVQSNGFQQTILQTTNIWNTTRPRASLTSTKIVNNIINNTLICLIKGSKQFRNQVSNEELPLCLNSFFFCHLNKYKKLPDCLLSRRDILRPNFSVLTSNIPSAWLYNNYWNFNLKEMSIMQFFHQITHRSNAKEELKIES